MRILTFKIFFFYGIVFLLVNPGESLRCRSGNQRSNDQVRKAMQTCRKKWSSSGSGNGNGNDYISSENENSDQDSTSSMSLDEELYFGNSNKRYGGDSLRNGGSNNGQSSNGNNGENRWNDRSRQDRSFNNRMTNPSNYTGMHERVNGMSNQNQYSNYHTAQSQNQESSNNNNNNNNHRDRAECVTHCLFDELNLVDRRGFPERGSVIEVMTRGVQDPGLRDFIEESISECFRYLESDTNNHEKCSFSNNLMNCFADKARDRCEDWDDQ